MSKNDQRIAESAMLTPTETRHLSPAWRGRARYEPQFCLHELFERQVERTPDGVALVFENQHLTYRELNARANQLANYLRGLGVGPETVVGLYAERSLELVMGMIGILKAGGAYLPIDPIYPKERIAFILEDAGVRVLLTQEHLLTTLAGSGAGTVCLNTICLDSEWQTIAQKAQENLPLNAGPENLAYIIYTSGSTGQPKGCLVTHYNVVRLMQAIDSLQQFGEDDVWTLFHSHAFDFSVWEIWGALFYGGRLVVVPYWTSRSPELFHQLLREQRVTVLNQTPSAFRQLMQADEAAGDSELALRVVILGGEALDLESLRRWFERRGDQRPQIVNMYGITETTVHVTYRPITLNDLRESRGSLIGGPLPDIQLHILDEQLQPVPVGVPGEICVGGPCVARGYLNRPELTRERFIQNPFSTESGDRLYRSGDLARRLADGDIEYLGRMDHQVKIRGHRIELGEIEAALKDQSEIAQAVVVAREDRPGDQRLAAYLLATNGAAPKSAELRRRLKMRLPDYMLPSSYTYLEKLPLTHNGKFDRNALPAPTEASTVQPENSDSAIGAAHLKNPSTPSASDGPSDDPILARLSIMWRDLLGLRSIRNDDNFFELGGHSLLAAKLIGQIDKAFKIKLDLSSLFHAPTLAQLAAYIAASTRNGAARVRHVVVPIQPAGQRPPFLCVGGGPMYLKFASLLGQEQPFLGLPWPDAASLREPFTLEDFAAHQVEAIREVQPNGPYFLGGYSAGALAAYEAARQLRAQGDEVSLLVLFDCENPAAPQGLAHIQRLNDRISSIAAKVRYHASKLAAIRVRNIPRYLRDRLKWQRYMFSVHAWSFLYRIHQRLGRPIPLWMRDSNKILIHCFFRYRPAPNPSRTLLFRHVGGGISNAEDPLLGWGELCIGEFEVCDVPGNHREIFIEPNVQVMAEKFSRSLQDVHRAARQKV
jgi:amino acid adenylation domain-containing protein